MHAKTFSERSYWRATRAKDRLTCCDVPGHIEDDGINVIQQKTGKQLWVPLHANLRGALTSWDGSPYVRTPKGGSYTPDGFRAAWTRLMNGTPAGRIRKEGYTFHGLRASSVEKLREAGCGDARN